MKYPNTVAAKGDWEKRSPHIYWPTGFTPADADLFSHNELLIDATCTQVWKHLVDAARWPEWYSNSRDVRIAREDKSIANNTGRGAGATLAQGGRFSWKTFGLGFDCQVSLCMPSHHLGWFGQGAGMRSFHAWHLMPWEDCCWAVVEHVAKGPAAVEMRNKNIDGVHAGHALWLGALKARSEAGKPG